MRRFFIWLFVLSIIATGVTFYWRTYLPENTVAQTSQTRGYNRDPGSGGAPPTISISQSEPSERQDLAMTISILSSVISALAALMQTWLTARAYRRN